MKMGCFAVTLYRATVHIFQHSYLTYAAGLGTDRKSLCLKLLLQLQPVARDLRLISAAFKMITDMERIGDHAQNIAEWVEYAVTGKRKGVFLT